MSLEYILSPEHFHIEISSKCTLRCPRCARQEVPDSLVNTQLELSFFEKAFTPDLIKSNVKKVTFCGDDGDPIYARDLISVIKYFKQHNDVQIVIVTNGSYKSTEWWQELGSVLSDKDQVHFSLDGHTQEINEQYRINSDFASITSGIQALRSSSNCHMTWAAIAFKFNQKYINDMVDTARDLGFDQFQLTKSTKFGSKYEVYGSDDPLEPDGEFVSSGDRFTREIINLTNRPIEQVIHNVGRYATARTIHDSVTPICVVGGKGLFINSQGRLFPCCWVANRYSHNSEWMKLVDKFNLYEKTVDQVLSDEFWSTEFKKFRWYECQTKCKRSAVDFNYASNW